MADRKKYHLLQIDKIDKQIDKLNRELDRLRTLQGIHFTHLQKGT